MYDQYRNRHRWTDSQRRYWEQRQRAYRDRNRVGFLGENWREYNRDRDRNQVTSNGQRIQSREIVRTNTTTRERTRSERGSSWVDRRRSQLERQSNRDSRRRDRD